MRTIVSNEEAVWQRGEDGGRLLSVVQSGSLYRFIVEAMINQPEVNGLKAYTYPEELHRSGLYDDAQTAQAAALHFQL